MNILNIVSIFCLAFCFIMFLYFKWYIKKRTTSSGLDERQTEVVKLIDEIDRITDRDSQLVEDRVNKLKILLLDVDKRIALYEKEIEQLQSSKNELSQKPNETLYTSLGRGIHAALKTPAQQLEKPHSAEQLLLETGMKTPGIYTRPVSQQEPPLPVKSETQKIEIKEKQIPKAPTKKQIRSAIDSLANEGLAAEEIASRLELSLPEVNLAMKLRRK